MMHAITTRQYLPLSKLRINAAYQEHDTGQRSDWTEAKEESSIRSFFPPLPVTATALETALELAAILRKQ